MTCRMPCAARLNLDTNGMHGPVDFAEILERLQSLREPFRRPLKGM
jgi:hypothetical protein